MGFGVVFYTQKYGLSWQQVTFGYDTTLLSCQFPKQIQYRIRTEIVSIFMKLVKIFAPLLLDIYIEELYLEYSGFEKSI